MAVAGDVIIRLLADFAQFAEGMTQSTKALGDLGKEVEKTNASLQSAIGWLKGLAGTAAVAFVVNKVNAYTAAIDQQALAIARLQQQYKLSAIEVQALQAAADKTGRSFAELVEHAGKNPKWLESIVGDAQAAGTALDEGVVRSISDMDAKSTEATKKINAMFAPFYASTKATALENIANTLDGIVALMTRAANHEGFWSKMGSLFRGGVIDPVTGKMGEAGEREKDLQDIENAARRVAAAQREIDRAAQSGAGIPRHDAVRAAELAAAQKQLEKLTNAEANRAARASANIAGNTETNVPFIPDLPKDTRSGGGGGRTDAENIDAQIARYRALAGVAQRAGETISANREKNIEDLQREVRVQQQVEEIAAKLGAKYADADQARKDQLHDEILLYEKRKDANQQALQDAQKATELEIRYGDGLKARQQIERDIAKAKDTNRVSTEALTRAEKALEEQADQNARTMRRYDDDLGSLAAGFEAAAASYARSHDLFSQGGDIFNAVTGAMGEGLDALAGKSSKTFGQIAEDFALMLTKMALQAAVSPLLKILGNSVGSLFAPSIDTEIANWSTYGTRTPRAGGGAVYAGQSYMVGEYGPERFVPAAAGRIEPSGGGDVIVNIANYTDGRVSAGKSKGPGGQLQLNVIVEAVEGKMAARLSLGQGALGRTMEGSYGLQRVGR